MKKTKILKEQLKTTMKLYDNEKQITVNELQTYLRAMKEKVDERYILTPHLFKPSKGRSKSCNTVFIRSVPLRSERVSG